MKSFILSITLLGLAAVMTTGFVSSNRYSVHEFKAFNGIKFEYALLLPVDFDRSQQHEIVALHCETHKTDEAWDETMASLASIDLSRTILIVPKVPMGKDGWGTHPIHHAFNDLLKSVRKSHGKPHQKFHLVGLEAGQEVAFWWTYGSSSLLASTTVINGQLWKEDRWDLKWYNNLSSLNVPLYAYEETVPSKFDMSNIHFKPLTTISTVLRDIEERSGR